MLLGVLAFLAALFALVLVHEAGHWWVARRVGMRASVFSIGFGRRLAGFRWRGTDFRLSAVPLGGYVRIDDMEEVVDGPDGPVTRFERHPARARAAVLLAGVTMNLFLAVALYLALPLVWGVEVDDRVRIARVDVAALPDGAEPWTALPPDVVVASVDGEPVRAWQDVLLGVMAAEDGRVELGLAGSAAPIRLPVPATEEARLLLLETLVRGDPPRVRVGPVGAARDAGERLRDAGALIAGSWALVLEGRVSVRQLSGPLGIAEATGRVLSRGWEPFLSLVAFLSLNVAVINLLPIPTLDGGHLALLGAETLRRRPLPRALQAYLGRVGTIWLVLVMAGTVVNDMLRLAGR